MAKFGRSLCVVLAELRDGAGTLAATATVTYSVPPAVPGPGPRSGIDAVGGIAG
ncbi:hypothetical protein LUW75_02965 [Streptomyces sp. MRC013]|uniref:hypothetical protein n=1 Tax=Streptomyces sp. MRC013 TaxID=2898276 RepID=UPI002025B9C7|nr:hypothetical protein [Streptomyces sp. MRC013]URM89140.1 hypothetical protein LUW75_02965 [Streptomyces sp. MRC013]